MSLRLLYLIFQQMLRLNLAMGRTATSKDIELLVLRHEVAVLRRTTPHPAWAGPTEQCSPHVQAVELAVADLENEQDVEPA